MEDTALNSTAKEGTALEPISETARRGGQRGNDNNLRHGLKAGKLPVDARYIEARLNALRRELEALVIEVKGAVNLADAALIQTCLRWEKHAELCQRWLRKELASLTPEQRLRFSESVAKASAARDKAIEQLGLNRPKEPMRLDDYLAQRYGAEEAD